MKPTSQPAEVRSEEILDRILAREQDGLKLLLSCFAESAVRDLRMRYGSEIDESLVDEALSAAALQAWNAATDFDRATHKLRAWFVTIVRHCFLSKVSNQQRRRYVSLDTLQGERAACPRTVQAPAQEGLLMDIHRAVERLGGLARRVLKADIEAGCTVAAIELAKRFCTTSNSIYVARRKGRRKFAELLEEMGHDEHAQRSRKLASSQPYAGATA
ncbi:MAG: RNA polymerase sigma factor [Planctomycetota bacterium]